MMLRPIEFNTAGNPWPGQSDERRLDDVLIVNEIVSVRFVLNGMDSPANFRQHEHAEKFVFNPNRLPLPRNGLLSNAVGERKWINLAATALIDALLQEHRIFIRWGWRICRQSNGCFPDLNLIVLFHWSSI